VLGRLAASGALICADPRDADTLIINTCGFIAPAIEESIGTIHEAARLKQRGTCRRLVVMGCLVQRHGSRLRRELPDVDAFVGVGDVEAVLRACGVRPRGTPGVRLRFGLPHVAYLRIADGCDNRCAYCTIPIIRGPFRSRPEKKILAEARDLTADGARELVLVAQDTTSYGRDLPGASLPRLIEKLQRRCGDAWLRLMYTHPAHFGDDLIEAFRSAPALCSYVDLPLQHLADPILKRMGRRVTQARILGLIDKLRDRIPGVALRTTFIVGFPGETDEHFEELLRLVGQIRFDHLGVFTYSREPDTRAARMRAHVPETVKEQRRDALMRRQYDIVGRRNRQYEGRVVEVMVDGRSEDGRFAARTRCQAPEVDSIVLIETRRAEPGQRLSARITGVQGYDLVARPCSSPAAAM